MLSANKDVLSRLRGITDAEMCLLVIAVAIGLAVILASATAAEPTHAGSSSPPEVWNPEPATYGIVKETNVPVTMSDGTVLRADVYRPSDRAWMGR